MKKKLSIIRFMDLLMIALGLFFVFLIYLEEKHGLMHPVTIAIPVYILIILIARLILSGHVKIK